MEKKFSGCEIVELGIHIEENGRDFYSTLARKTHNPQAVAIFEYLAGEEEKHIDTFRKIHAITCSYEPKEAYPEEYFAYMNSLASQYVFTQKNKGGKIAMGVKDYNEGIDLGIQFEKDSIHFYEEIKKIVPDKEKELIDQLISEERKHLKQLCDLKGE